MKRWNGAHGCQVTANDADVYSSTYKVLYNLDLAFVLRLYIQSESYRAICASQ